LAHALPEDGIFMPKHVGVNSVMLYAHDTVYLSGCNNMMIQNAWNKQLPEHSVWYIMYSEQLHPMLTLLGATSCAAP
jgi:hypothetical protein